MKKFIALFILCFSFLNAAEESPKTVFVTGGAGFMASNFVNHMFKAHPNYNIIVLDAMTYAACFENINDEVVNSSRFEFYKGSICNEKIVDEIMGKSDLVVHFAAETDVTRSIQDDKVFFETNVMGTRCLLRSLLKHRDKVERFIHISSSEVYGTCEEECISETHPLNPRSPYAAAKLGAERTVYAYACTYDLPVATLRFFNNYGPGQHLEKVVAKLITQAIEGKVLTVHGTGEQARDWIHTSDTARAVDAALHVENFDQIKGEAINCGTGKATSIIDIAEAILAYFDLDKNMLVFTGDRPGQVMLHLSSTEKAKRLLNWQSTVSFNSGIIRTIKWYEQNREQWANQLNDPQLTIDNEDLYE